MTQGLTGWETTRLSKHFILLDFMADHEVYRTRRRSIPLAFDETWNDEHDAVAKGLCNDLLEPLTMDERFGPISIADAFWPSVFKSGHAEPKSSPGMHRWTESGAAADIALYRMLDEGVRGEDLRKAVLSVPVVNRYLERVMSYPKTEFVCVTFKSEDARKRGKYDKDKSQKLRAHHVRVGRNFNLLDFCRSGRAVEEGRNLVPKGAENNSGPDYCPIPEEMAARSFAAALDPFVEKIGRISVVRGIETDGFADDKNAELHRWDGYGPWRLVFVLPQGTNPEEACDLLRNCPHVRDVQPSPHPSDSWSLALVVDRKEYKKHRGLRPKYPCGYFDRAG